MGPKKSFIKFTKTDKDIFAKAFIYTGIAFFVLLILNMAISIFKLGDLLYNSHFYLTFVTSIVLVFFVSAITISKQELFLSLLNKKNRENGVSKIDEIYKLILDSTDDAIYVINRNYRYVFVNKKYVSMVGEDEITILNGSYHDVPILYAEETEVLDTMMNAFETVFSEGTHQSVEITTQRDNKHYIKSISPIYDALNKIVAALVIVKDISYYGMNNSPQCECSKDENWRQLAITDSLTGVYNQRGFNLLSEQQLSMAKRIGKKVSVVFIDVDDLKVVNDTYGHAVGNELLTDCAYILRHCFREHDIVSRWGGDEFVVFMIDGYDEELIHKRINEHISLYEQHKAKRNMYKIDVSIGTCSVAPTDDISIQEMINIADTNMYKTKMLRKSNSLVRSMLDCQEK